VTEASGPSHAELGQLRPACDLEHVCHLLKSNLEEIEQLHPFFDGTFTIDVIFCKGQIETVAVERRQTFKD
jgi:hypothetical protein